MKKTLITLLLTVPLLTQASEVWIMGQPSNNGMETIVLPDGRHRTIVTPRAYSYQPYGSDYRGYGDYDPDGRTGAFARQQRALRRSNEWGKE